MVGKSWERELEGIRADLNFVWFAIMQIYASLADGTYAFLLRIASYYFVLLWAKGKIRHVLWNFGKKQNINTKVDLEK